MGGAPVVQDLDGGKAGGQQGLRFVLDSQGRVVVIQPLVPDALLLFEAKILRAPEPLLLIGRGTIIRQDKVAARLQRLMNSLCP